MPSKKRLLNNFYRNMFRIIEKNRLFFTLYFICFFIVFLNEFNKPMLDATLYFGEHRTTFGDGFFKFWTLLGEAYPYFLVAAFFFFYQKDKLNTQKSTVTGITILIVTFLLKEAFEYPRPAAILDQMGYSSSFNFVDGIDIHTGPTSFPSGHTASAFALFGLLSFQFYKHKTLQVIFFFTAFLVGLSRVYLTQHFPQDTLFGSVVGLVIAMTVEYLFEKKPKEFSS